MARVRAGRPSRDERRAAREQKRDADYLARFPNVTVYESQAAADRAHPNVTRPGDNSIPWPPKRRK